jgi:hypothetical protein
MYKAIYRIQPECINEKENKIFTPFLNCYELHSVFVNSDGHIENIFHWEGNFSYIKRLYIHDSSFNLTFDINYFYIRLNHTPIFESIIDSNYKDKENSKSIASKHYIEGQFSLDNGLYKNAVMNFGTTLECLLNKRLDNSKFEKLINQYQGLASKEDMHYIRELRNKVHPNRIKDFQDITQSEAVDARNKLEVILKHFSTDIST